MIYLDFNYRLLGPGWAPTHPSHTEYLERSHYLSVISCDDFAFRREFSLRHDDSGRGPHQRG